MRQEGTGICFLGSSSGPKTGRELSGRARCHAYQQGVLELTERLAGTADTIPTAIQKQLHAAVHAH